MGEQRDLFISMLFFSLTDYRPQETPSKLKRLKREEKIGKRKRPVKKLTCLFREAGPRRSLSITSDSWANVCGAKERDGERKIRTLLVSPLGSILGKDLIRGRRGTKPSHD